MLKKLIAVCMLICMFFVLASCSKAEPSRVQFLQSYGNIHYMRDSVSPSFRLSLYCVTKGETDLKEGDISVAFDTALVSAENAMLHKTMSHKGYTLWHLSCDVSMQSEVSTDDLVSISTIQLDGRDALDLGKLSFRIIEGDAASDWPLNLLSHSGAPMGIAFRDYFATFQNAAADPLILSRVAVPGYPNASSSFEIDGVMHAPGSDGARLLPEQSTSLSISFADAAQEGMQIYYVTPVMHYLVKDVSYQLTLPAYIVGAQMLKSDLQQYGDAMSW